MKDGTYEILGARVLVGLYDKLETALENRKVL